MLGYNLLAISIGLLVFARVMEPFELRSAQIHSPQVRRSYRLIRYMRDSVALVGVYLGYPALILTFANIT